MRLQVLKKITYLEDTYCSTCTLLPDATADDKHIYCRTKCDIGKKLQECGNKLDEISSRKARRIFKKEKDMTTNDIQYLINRGYTKEKIGQALGLSKNLGQKALRDFNEYGEIPDKVRSRNGREIISHVFELLDKGMTVKEIVAKTNYNENTVYGYRSRWKNHVKG